MPTTKRRPAPEIPAPAERQIIPPRSTQAGAIMARDLARLHREYRARLKRQNGLLERLLPKSG